MAMKPPVRHERQPQRHRGLLSHPNALRVMTCMLTGVTIVALLSLGSLFIGPQSLVAREHPSELVRRFYAAANELLAGGSPAALEAVVAADLVGHQAGGPTRDRDALVRQLTDLRRAAPGVQLRVSTIVEEGEWGAAQVTLLGLHLMVHGVPLDLVGDPPAQTELFRVVDGKIVEYWPGGPALDVPRALPSVLMAPWVADTTVSLARLTFPSGASLGDLDAPGEHLILLENGGVGVDLAGPSSLLDAEHLEAGWQATPASGQKLVLRAGDAVLIPPGTRHTMSNVQAGAATVLGMATFPIASLDTMEPQIDVDGLPLLRIYNPGRAGKRTTWDRRVSVEVLVAGLGEARLDPCAALARTQVTVTLFSLGPGEGLPAHPVTGLELLAIPSSRLAVAVSGLASDSPPAPAPSNDRLRGATTMPRAGQGLALTPPSAPPIRNTGRQPLDLVSVALQPTGGASCAVAPIDT